MADPESTPQDPDEFDPETATIDNGLEQRSAFSEALATQGFHDVLVLTRDRADDVLHDRRLQIIDYLEDHDPDSVRALASELGHDKGTISRDLSTLSELDVIEFVDDGKSRAPRLKHRHVVVEPLV